MLSFSSNSVNCIYMYIIQSGLYFNIHARPSPLDMYQQKENKLSSSEGISPPVCWHEGYFYRFVSLSTQSLRSTIKLFWDEFSFLRNTRQVCPSPCTQRLRSRHGVTSGCKVTEKHSKLNYLFVVDLTILSAAKTI
jgi:hypothetical protein